MTASSPAPRGKIAIPGVAIGAGISGERQARPARWRALEVAAGLGQRRGTLAVKASAGERDPIKLRRADEMIDDGVAQSADGAVFRVREDSEGVAAVGKEAASRRLNPVRPFIASPRLPHAQCYRPSPVAPAKAVVASPRGGGEPEDAAFA